MYVRTFPKPLICGNTTSTAVSGEELQSTAQCPSRDL